MVASIFFPARPLFVLKASGMAVNVLQHEGVLGTRLVSSPKGGTFSGPRLQGTIAPGLANEWQLRSSVIEGLAHVEGLITLLGSEGGAILMKYVGRRAERYGDGEWRIAITFEASSDGAYDWLNDVAAVARVQTVGNDLEFTVHELLRRTSAIDDNALPGEPLYEMVASGSVGERHIIKGQIGSRYLSVAEEGCETTGALTAKWPAGFSWGAHRISAGDPSGIGMPFHIDLKVEMIATGGDLIVQHYVGTNSRAILNPAPDTDRSWLTIAMYEAPAKGSLAYLNEVVALGIGWTENNEAHYRYVIWQ